MTLMYLDTRLAGKERKRVNLGDDRTVHGLK